MAVFSFFCAMATGNMGNLSTATINGGSSAISLGIRLLGIVCMWNGFVAIAQKSGLTQRICALLSPLLKILFPTLKDKEAKEAIAMNMTANLLGLDNAATPLGLKAMSRLQELNQAEAASDHMVRLVVINTASLHLVPTTIAMLRGEYGSQSPAEILLPALLTSACSITVGVCMTTILRRLFR
ncbi:MAG: spore maturation protein A [Clostridia bacterium]|nr:spore maturation protein A [Clostridia bacterium]